LARPDLENFLAMSVHDEFILDAPADGRADEASAIGCQSRRSMGRKILKLF
jgi:hypothetical protein